MSESTTAVPADAEVQLPGEEIVRFFYLPRRGLLSIRSNGTSWIQTPERPTWRHLGTKKLELSLEEWRQRWLDTFAAAPAWAKELVEIPTLDELMDQSNDGVCDTPTGHTVEPDGEGPDGVPSWLRLLGYI